MTSNNITNFEQYREIKQKAEKSFELGDYTQAHQLFQLCHDYAESISHQSMNASNPDAGVNITVFIEKEYLQSKIDACITIIYNR